jgi:hypothetical protein
LPGDRNIFTALSEETNRPTYTPREEFPADKVIGGVAMAIDSIGLVLGCARLSTTRDPDILRMQQQSAYGPVVALTFALGLLGIWIHYGIFNGRRWAFVVTLILSCCGMLGLFAKDVGALQVVTSLGLLIYSALRLGKGLGPDPH